MYKTTFKSTKHFVILASAIAFALVGCGGSGTAASSSPFVGNWAGTYTGTGESGTASVQIQANGDYVGSGFDNTAGVNYSVQGHITNAGTVTGSLTEGSTTITLNGNWTITNGHLGGSVTASQNGVIGATNTYDMTPM